MWEMETARWLGEGGVLSLPQWIEEERRKHRAVKLPTQHPTAYGKAQRWLLTPRETGAGGGRLTHHHILGTCYAARHTTACRRYTASDPGPTRF